MKIIFFTTCKPMIGSQKWIQKQSILSWKKLNKYNCNVDIIIFGDDYGVKEFCERYDLIYKPEIRKLDKIPYMYNMMKIVNEYSKDDNDIIIYSNSDIIFRKSLIDTLFQFKKKYKLKEYLLVGQRNDWFDPKKINKDDLIENNFCNIMKETKLHAPSGIDYLIHSNRTLIDKIDKNFLVATEHFDMKILGTIIKNYNIFVCDCTKTINIIHHEDSRSYRSNEEYKDRLEINLNIKASFRNIKDCPYKSYYNNKKIEFKFIPENERIGGLKFNR